MAGKNMTVFGISSTRASLEIGVNALKAAGFSNNDISARFPQNEGTKDFAHRKEHKSSGRHQQAPGRERFRAEDWGGWLEGCLSDSGTRTVHRRWPPSCLRWQGRSRGAVGVSPAR
jgi:hypothetical protein